MVRLIRLEYLKLRHNKAMWVLLGLYLVAIVGISFGAGYILQVLADNGVEYRGIDPTVFPIYDFDDIWQNLAYLGYFFNVFPAFLIVISITNEFANKTHRQNIIDGLSRTEFFLSKLSFAAFLSLLSGLFLLMIGLLLGFMHSDVLGTEAIFSNMVFAPVHALQLFLYFLFAMLLSLIIRKSGITIVLLLMYTVILEPILTATLGYWYPGTEDFLPLHAISNLVHFPFPKYFLRYVQDYLAIKELAIAVGWGVIFTTGIFLFLKKRDF